MSTVTSLVQSEKVAKIGKTRGLNIDRLGNEDIGNNLRFFQRSAFRTECSLHHISPYIGKIKSSIASYLIRKFSQSGDLVYTPFSGSGTFSLEAWIAGRAVVATDLNPYAQLLTKAKLFPELSQRRAYQQIENIAALVERWSIETDLRKVPSWVKSFYHPLTLEEVIAWVQFLRSSHNYFLLGCLLGILHHQRPGFLSYPSSHTTPYLRSKNFPRSEFPELYEYRSVIDRLKRKVDRCLIRVPNLDAKIPRRSFREDVTRFDPGDNVKLIISSPPYMRQLDYARDNRLRLWFLGIDDWKRLDQRISPSQSEFIRMIRKSLRLWQDLNLKWRRCVLVLGDVWCSEYDCSLPEAVQRIAVEEVGGYRMIWRMVSEIPDSRRVRRNGRGTENDVLFAFARS
ncbi:MAG: hypothetical protein M1587_11850 [Thaumarchaeota archaeon]|nr:hypothetical protein [Nitrososphaerota archaeon]